LRPGKAWAGKQRPPTAREEAFASRASERASEKANREARISKALRADLERAEKALDFYLSQNVPLREPRVTGRPSIGAKQACPILVASDWHVEERVIPSHVNNLNEYGPDIATKRARAFADGALWLIETQRKGAKIEEAVLAAIGDFITGWIHEELVAGNAMMPTEATLHAQQLLYDVIATLLKHGGLKRLHVVCSRGNHGRITKKTYINAAARLSFEWMMFNVLALRFKDDPRVTFTIGDSYLTYVPIYDKVVRFHHGDAVSYQGGVGGITVPLRKKIAKWDEGRQADLDVMGHFHQLLYGGDFVVNGSLIGWNDYATWIGASPEPPQQAFVLMRPGRGVSSFSPIFVT
jgi:hypothetical protein